LSIFKIGLLKKMIDAKEREEEKNTDWILQQLKQYIFRIFGRFSECKISSI